MQIPPAAKQALQMSGSAAFASGACFEIFVKSNDTFSGVILLKIKSRVLFLSVHKSEKPTYILLLIYYQHPCWMLEGLKPAVLTKMCFKVFLTFP